MDFTSEAQAIEVLNNRDEPQTHREKAIRYLADLGSESAVDRLVWALQDDDFGARWEAAVSLSHLGDKALPVLLSALTDPERVADPRLREGAYHILHYTRDQHYVVPTTRLMQALKSPAADIATMVEAGRLQRKLAAIGMQN
jgi:HEAT repeat protein